MGEREWAKKHRWGTSWLCFRLLILLPFLVLFLWKARKMLGNTPEEVILLKKVNCVRSTPLLVSYGAHPHPKSFSHEK